MVTNWTPDELSAWRPPEKLTVSEWARQNVWLEQSAEPGRYDPRRTPYAREWQDSANLNWIRQVTILASTQVAKSTSLYNLLAYFVCQDPAPIVLVLPRNVDIPTVSKTKLEPLLRNCPALQAETTKRRKDITRREMSFRRATVYLRSATSPADLASVAARFVLCDELAKWDTWSGREASPLDLVRERQRTYWNSLLFACSTARLRDDLIQTEWADGDRRRYYVPCPHCQKLQVLRWNLDRVRWPDDCTTHQQVGRRQEAWYVCEFCDGRIEDRHKRQLLDAGVWVPEGKDPYEWRDGGHRSDRARHRSYHIWAAYSPWLSWWQIVERWLYSKEAPERLQNFFNSWLCEPWEEEVEQPSTDSVTKAKVFGAKRGQIPEKVLVATAGVDVQKASMFYVVRGWGLGEESWLLDAGEVQTWDQLGDVLFRQPWTANGLAVHKAVIDSRHRRDEVLDFAHAQPRVVMGAGVERDGPLLFTTTKLDRHPKTGAPLEHSQLIWNIAVGQLKDILAHWMHRPEHWHLPSDLPPGYQLQMASEHKIRVTAGRKKVDRWVVRPGAAANHYWDCEVYALAAARIARVDVLRRMDPAKVATKNAPVMRAGKRAGRAGRGILGGMNPLGGR